MLFAYSIEIKPQFTLLYQIPRFPILDAPKTTETGHCVVQQGFLCYGILYAIDILTTSTTATNPLKDGVCGCGTKAAA